MLGKNKNKKKNKNSCCEKTRALEEMANVLPRLTARKKLNLPAYNTQIFPRLAF